MKITEYLHKIMEHSPCKAGQETLRTCCNPLDVLKASCTPDGRDFLMVSIRDGWGPTGEDFIKEYPDYVNTGREIMMKEGREKVTFWCGPGNAYAQGDIRTILMLIDFEGVVYINKSILTVVMIAGNSKVQIVGDNQSGRVYINLYGGEVTHISGVSQHTLPKRKNSYLCNTNSICKKPMPQSNQ